GGERPRPDDPAVVVPAFPFDGAGEDAVDPDAVAAHHRLDRPVVLVGDGHLERLGVLVTQLEDVPDLDAAGHVQRPAAARLGRGVAVYRVADVGDVHLHAVRGDVALPVEVPDVVVGLVRAGDPEPALRRVRVDDQ